MSHKVQNLLVTILFYPSSQFFDFIFCSTFISAVSNRCNYELLGRTQLGLWKLRRQLQQVNLCLVVQVFDRSQRLEITLIIIAHSSKGIDLIGDEFKPKQNGLNGHTSYDLKDLDTNDHHHIHNSSLNHTPTSLSDMQAINVTGATAPTTNLGPNMVLVNSAGGTTQTAVPIQQIIQQAQQQQQLQQVKRAKSPSHIQITDTEMFKFIILSLPSLRCFQIETGQEKNMLRIL